MTRYCGRNFSAQDLDLIRQLISEDPSRCRADLSRLTCRALHWFKVDGGLKEMSCRVAMLRMQADGLIRLPPPKGSYRKTCRIPFSAATDPQPVLDRPAHALAALRLTIVSRAGQSRLWNEYITTTLALRPCLGRSSAILSAPAKRFSHCLVLAPAPGKQRHVIHSSAGAPSSGREICISSSTTVAFSCCPG
jgi:hypothetical protein